MTEPLIITIKDLKADGYCNQKLRPWFKRMGFDWNDFVINGIEWEKLKATGDGRADRVRENALGRRI